MWQVSELIPYINKSKGASSSRLFFALYYKVNDNAFKWAALTWENVIKQRYGFVAGKDRFYSKEISSEKDFRTAWFEIYSIAQQHNLKVSAGNVLTHASKQDDRRDGLEFSPPEKDDPPAGNDGTLTHMEIVKLKKLPWDNSGFLILSGCNTGLAIARNWAPAYSFALTQKIPTVGQMGYAYFSKNWQKHESVGNADRNICLWAYKRTGNRSHIEIADKVIGWPYGPRIPGKVFKV